MKNGNPRPRGISGEALRALLERQVGEHLGDLHDALSPFEAASAVQAWMETIRAVEEFINLPLSGLDDEALVAALVALPVDAATAQPRRFLAVRRRIAGRYGEAFARRFTTLLVQGAAIGQAFAWHDIASAAAGFASVGTLVDYFQSRRRHLVALLYTLPTACIGSRRLPRLDALNVLLPLVELNGIALTGLYQQLMLAHAFPKYEVVPHRHGFVGSREFTALDALFLEPERASIVEMHAVAPTREDLAELEPIRRDRLFSAAELRNGIRLLEATYAEFDLAGSDFRPAASFVRRLSALAREDYWISIAPARFTKLADAEGLPPTLRRALIQRADDYVANTNGYAPFVAIAGELRTTVTLLSRFLNHWKNVCLYRVRRFQIRSGFIFEQTVATALERQGFAPTGIKRINRKEFDVVATRDGIVYNVQCKNNLVDWGRLEADVVSFARYNRVRVAGYERALRKEVGRESLLTARLGLGRVEHFVVTRFPVATDNPRIVPFNRIDEMASLASSMTGRSKGPTP